MAKQSEKKTPEAAEGKKPAKWLYIFNIVLLAAVFVGIAVFINTAPRPNASTEENRDLAKCPRFSIESYFSGEFTEGFSSYFNDTVPMRSTWKEFISNMRYYIGIEYDDGVTIHGPMIEVEK